MFNINKVFNKNKERPSNIKSNASKVLAGVIAVGGVASSQGVLGANKDKVSIDKVISYEQNSNKEDNNYVMSKEDLKNINELSREAKLDLLKKVLNNYNDVYVEGDYIYINSGLENIKEDFSTIQVVAYNSRTSTYYMDNSISIPWGTSDPKEVLDFVEKNGIESINDDSSPGGKIKVTNDVIETGVIGPSYVYNRIRETGKNVKESILLMSKINKNLVGEIIDGLYESISSGGVYEGDKNKNEEVKKEIEEIESIKIEDIQDLQHLASN